MGGSRLTEQAGQGRHPVRVVTLVLAALLVIAACGSTGPGPTVASPELTAVPGTATTATTQATTAPGTTASATAPASISSTAPRATMPVPPEPAQPELPRPGPATPDASLSTTAELEDAPPTAQAEGTPPTLELAVAAATGSPEPEAEPTARPRPTPVPSPTVPLEPTSSATPVPSFAPQIIGYVIDPATALPVVPEGVGGPWWWDGQPRLGLDPSLRFSSEAPAADAVDPDQRRVSLLARFGSHEEARTVAEELAAAVGDSAAESAWLTEAGQDGAPGFGWIGSAGSITPFVQAIDRWLIVSELAYDPGFDPGDAIEESPRYRSPLALALASVAEELIVEDTWARDKSVAFDLVCHGDPALLLTLSQDLADNAELYDMQPVWLAPGITAEQRRARRTLRLVDTLDNATLSGLVDDTEFQRLASIVREVGSAGTVAIDEALEDLATYIEEWILASRPDLEPLAELLDVQVLEASASEFARRAAVEVLAGELTRPQDVASGQFAAAPYGAHHAPIPWIMGEAPSYAEQADDQLTMSLGLFHGVAAGLGPLVDHLAANGCGDIRVNFLDYGYGASLRG